MAVLNLTDQAVLGGQMQTRINQLKTAMDARKEVWNRMPLEKKRAWVTSGKDPIMTLSWQVYRYLKDNFFVEEDRG